MKNIFLILSSFLAAPKGLLNQFMSMLTEMGAQYDTAKTLADFIDTLDVIVDGVTTASVSSNFPQSEHMLVLGFRLFDSTTVGALNVKDWAPGSNAAGIKNGTLRIDNNGTAQLKSIPLTAFRTSNQADDAGYMGLLKPFLHIAQTDMVVNYSFPVAPAANSALRIQAEGLKFI